MIALDEYSWNLCLLPRQRRSSIAGRRNSRGTQEERFSRKKHDARFPSHAIGYCLGEGGIALVDIDYVVFYDKSSPPSLAWCYPGFSRSHYHRHGIARWPDYSRTGVGRSAAYLHVVLSVCRWGSAGQVVSQWVGGERGYIL